MPGDKRPTCVTVIGWFWIVVGALLCAGSGMGAYMLLLIRQTNSGVSPTDGQAFALGRSGIIAMTLCAVGVLALISGWKLLQLSEWARKVLRILTALAFAAVIGFAAFQLIGIAVGLGSGSGPASEFLLPFVLGALLNAAIIGVPLGFVLRYLGSDRVKGAMLSVAEQKPSDRAASPRPTAQADANSGRATTKKSWRTTSIVVSLAVMLASLAVITFMLGRMLMEDRISSVQSRALEEQMYTAIELLSAASIRTVTLYEDWYRANSVVDQISGQEELRRFVSALQTAEPSRPIASRRYFYVVVQLQSGRKIEYLFCLQNDRVVHIEFVKKHGTGLLHFGKAQSQPLYAWLQQRVGLHPRGQPLR